MNEQAALAHESLAACWTAKGKPEFAAAHMARAEAIRKGSDLTDAEKAGDQVKVMAETCDAITQSAVIADTRMHPFAYFDSDHGNFWIASEGCRDSLNHIPSITELYTRAQMDARIDVAELRRIADEMHICAHSFTQPTRKAVDVWAHDIHACIDATLNIEVTPKS